MTNKEIIYNALGIIEGAVCVSQKNTRDALMKAIEMIKNAINEDTDCNRGCVTCYANDMGTGEADNPCWNCKGNYSEWRPKTT